MSYSRSKTDVPSKGRNGGMSRLILVTGGARAGKSSFAQKLAERGSFHKRLFVATAVPCDSEMRRRIAQHRRSRGGLWTTLEESTRLPDRLPVSFLAKGNLILLDCLPTFLTNLLLQRKSDAQILSRVRRILLRVRRPGLTTLLVTNEVGLGVVPEHPLGRRFRDLLGSANQKVVQQAEEVYFLVAGIPMRLK